MRLAFCGLFLLVSLTHTVIAEERSIYRCDVTKKAARNGKHAPDWIEVTVDFDSGRAAVVDPISLVRGEKVHFGRVRRNTGALFAVTWRASVDIGYHRPSTILEHRLSVDIASGAMRYRTENIQAKGNVSGAGRCRLLDG